MGKLFCIDLHHKWQRIFIIYAAKTCCIAFVFHGETLVYQNCGESVFIRTSANKRVSAVIYNLFISLVIFRNGWNPYDACIIKSTVCNLCQKQFWNGTR